MNCLLIQIHVAFLILFCFSCNAVEIRTTLTGFTKIGVQKRQAITQCHSHAVLKKKPTATKMLQAILTKYTQR